MKQNLKANLVWLAFLAAGFILIQAMVSTGLLNAYYIQIVQQIGINIIMAVGLNLIVGFSGQFSLGHAGFMAIGAYAVGILGTRSPNYGTFFLALIIGMVLAGLVAFMVGMPTLRLKGDYLAIATLGVSEIIRILIVNGGDVTNGPRGIMSIPLFTSWQLVYVFVVITTIFTLNFLRSPIGRATISVREDEIAAESVGVNPTKMKVIAFVFGAVTAAIAGGLQAGYVGTIVPKDFAFMTTVNILIIIVLGGLGSMTGTFVAAILLGILNVYLKNFSDISMIIYSLALILLMIFRPGGLLGTKELEFSKFFKKKEGTN
ncbi:branched-chain amino acid ABC transporter permease [Streptococcus caprae]|uniref:Branched-chain amino acid ABC transporter permease n=1 Tax=Streptococcus caprae TaxID=1640501 RepID=A0ABV8CT57_9STRE